MRRIRSTFGITPRMMVIESLLTLGLGALMTIDAFLLQRIIIVVQQQDWAQFQTLLLIVILFVCIQAGVYFCRQYYTEHVANTSLRSLRESMVGRIAARPLAQASRNTSELLFSTLTSQLDQIKTNLIDVVLYGIMLLSQASFALIAILTLNPTLALVALALCVPMMLVPLLFRPRIEQARATVVNATNVLNSVIGDSLRGMVDWRVAGREHQVRSRIGKHDANWQHAADHDASVQMASESINNFFSHVLVFGIWLAGGVMIMNGVMDVAQIVAFSNLIGQISVPLFMMSGMVAQFQAGREVLRQAERTIPDASEQSHANPDHTQDLIQPGYARASPLTITYQNVRLHHANQPINMTFRSDHRYLVVGPSGSGKSSLVRLLFGLDDDYSGSIIINDRDGHAIDLQQASKQIGYCSQRSHVFNTSIRENVRLFDDAIPDATVTKALHSAMLGTWLERNDLDTGVDDTLNHLSGGERQRLLLARLLACGYRFAVLDEIDIGLDTSTLDNVEQAVLDSFPGFIYISHHPSRNLLHQVDEIIVMRDNAITATGPLSAVSTMLGTI